MAVIHDDISKPVVDPEGRVGLTINGFTKAGIREALMALCERERVDALSLVELMIVERARAAGIATPKTAAEHNAEVAQKIAEKHEARRVLA